MEFITHSHRHAEVILNQTEYKPLWVELKQVITDISDDDLMNQFPLSKNKMSLSAAINDLIDERLVDKGWLRQAPIFQDPTFEESNANRWRLDFAKDFISIEVAFNHGEALAWNLIKPVIASEMNHVKKAIQTKIGITILATNDLKAKGGFDGAVGTFEKSLSYIKALNNILTVPVLLIGLEAPKEFMIDVKKIDGSNKGIIRRL